MRTIPVLVLATLCILALPLFGADETCPAKWTYSGMTGPSGWPAMYPKCGGATQSPIRVTRMTGDSHPEPAFDYLEQKYPVILKNTSRELKVLPMFDGKMTYGAAVARLVQFHFHTGVGGTEHKLDLWKDKVAELHLVHETPEGRTFVVAVAIAPGPSNPALAALLNFGTLEECHSKTSRTDNQLVEMQTLLPKDRGEFVTYVGSLTTPPCSEGVTFLLMNDGITATPEQVNYLRIGAGNIRPPQQNSNAVTFRKISE